MASATTHAFTSIGIVTLIGFAGAFAFVAIDGVPRDRILDDPYRDPVSVLVTFPVSASETTTDAVRIGADGSALVDPFIIARTNITKVSVTVHLEMEDSTVGDRIDITVIAPNGDNRTGSIEGPMSTTGYRISQLIIADWPRATTPAKEDHETADTDEALRRAAANHTDRRSTGAWQIDLRITPPGTAVVPREGTVRFQFTLTHYEGQAHPAAPGSDEGLADGEDRQRKTERDALLRSNGPSTTYMTRASVRHPVDPDP
ncbi:MAG: hypothetical protein KY455_04630 [Euryarchaeota archaeon]|nr:hypothetical protein [Euryarchaeota archaeon]